MYWWKWNSSLSMLKVVIKIWLHVSNLMWGKGDDIVPFYDYYNGTAHPIHWIQDKAAKMYKKFKYTSDGVLDNIIPPHTAYQKAYADKLYDDCDGFHALMYHILHENQKALEIEDIALFCVIPLELKTLFQSHVVLAFKKDGIWYVLDYRYLYHWNKPTLIETMNDYWTQTFRRSIKATTNKCFSTSFQYNYDFRRWELADIKN